MELYLNKWNYVLTCIAVSKGKGTIQSQKSPQKNILRSICKLLDLFKTTDVQFWQQYSLQYSNYFGLTISHLQQNIVWCARMLQSQLGLILCVSPTHRPTNLNREYHQLVLPLVVNHNMSSVWILLPFCWQILFPAWWTSVRDLNLGASSTNLFRKRDSQALNVCKG
jgi:hypothetical protein